MYTRNGEDVAIPMPGRDNDGILLTRRRGIGQSMPVRHFFRVAHALWKKVAQSLPTIGLPDVWIAGAGTVGRVGSAGPAGPIPFEGISGAHRPDTYLDATWKLVE
jgi:hypothetical protein